MSNCEFCEEFDQNATSRFRKIYQDRLSSRVVASTLHFVALPTIGQLFPGSLLILPKKHFETCATLPASLHREMEEFISNLSEKISPLGNPIFFEHGAFASTGGSCGIYHAHVHLVPVPQKFSSSLFFDGQFKVKQKLSDCYSDLDGCENYLLMGNNEEVTYASANHFRSIPESQYFRKCLVSHFNLNRPWNWRKAMTPESDLIETVNIFTGKNAYR